MLSVVASTRTIAARQLGLMRPKLRCMPAALTALRYTSNTTQPSSELKELVTEWSKQIASERVVEVDTITPTAFVSMSLTLGRPLEESTAEWPNLDAETPPITTLEPPIGTPLPPNWHLIYFPPRLTEAQLASDGYETKWQPPPPFNRRVWAGGRLRWWWPESALRVGDRVRQETRCTAVETKRSAYGDMALVWTEKLLQTERGLAVRDERCIAYLPELSHESGSARPIRNTKIIKPNKVAEFSRELVPTSTLLFRYSALTFNSHRIHYDKTYAEHEGHPDCLVQGPLTCTLLLELLETQLRTSPRPLSLMSFSYRAVSPLYVNRPMKLCGRWLPNNETSEQESDEIRCELWALDDRGSLAMTGTATLEPIDAGTPGI